MRGLVKQEPGIHECDTTSVASPAPFDHPVGTLVRVTRGIYFMVGLGVLAVGVVRRSLALACAELLSVSTNPFY